MAYSDVAALATDQDFAVRTAAAYATETLNRDDLTDEPGQWQSQHAWDMAAQPGFGDAYASAVAGGIGRPGNEPSVISDGQILSAIQAMIPAVPTP